MKRDTNSTKKNQIEEYSYAVLNPIVVLYPSPSINECRSKSAQVKKCKINLIIKITNQNYFLLI